VVDLKVSSIIGSVVLGIAVFLIWIGPDLLFEGYRRHWLFENSVMGAAESSLSEAARNNLLFLVLRSTRAAILVPVIEELFWRGWLMRWIVDSNFKRVSLGAYTPAAFWITALLFASEHGPYWEVGLAAGILYNWWMVRTKRLGDCILAHAVTNAALSAYVIFAGKWEYWM
jgi:CAAX prenyl protease-like protein